MTAELTSHAGCTALTEKAAEIEVAMSAINARIKKGEITIKSLPNRLTSIKASSPEPVPDTITMAETLKERKLAVLRINELTRKTVKMLNSLAERTACS